MPTHRQILAVLLERRVAGCDDGRLGLRLERLLGRGELALEPSSLLFGRHARRRVLGGLIDAILEQRSRLHGQRMQDTSAQT